MVLGDAEETIYSLEEDDSEPKVRSSFALKFYESNVF